MCQTVFKAILRKFRKSAIFSYMQLDLSPASRSVLKSALQKKFEVSDAVIWHTDDKTFSMEEAFAKEALGLYAAEHYTAGQCVIYATEQKTAVFNDGKLCETTTCDTDRIKAAVSLAVKAATCRKRSLVMCTDTRSMADNILFREFEYSLGKEKHIDARHISLNELVWQSMRRIPSCDVILTTESAANIIAMHLCSAMWIPTGYVLWHTDKVCIYRREIHPYESLKITAPASILMSFSAVLENEFCHRGAADWLRRSVSLALEKNIISGYSDFLNDVIDRINKPIRNRQVK